MAESRGSGPGTDEPVLDVEKLRRFLSVPKGAVLEVEASCTCGPVRAANRPAANSTPKRNPHADREKLSAAKKRESQAKG